MGGQLLSYSGLQLLETQLAPSRLPDSFENQPMSANKPPCMHCFASPPLHREPETALILNACSDSLLASSSKFRSGLDSLG